MRYTPLAVLVAAAATLAACSGGSTQSAATPAVPTPDQTSLLPQSGPAPLKPGASPQVGCPVDAAALEKALIANKELSSDVQLGKGLTDVSCALDYATAKTEGDRVTLLFNYDTTQKMWVALGSKCDKAPADVRKQLKNCS